MTVNVGRANTSSVTADLILPNGQDLADALEEIKLQTVTPSKKSIKHLASTDSTGSSSKSSFFTFRRKSSKESSNEKSFSNKMMRKFVSNGNSNANTKAPVSLRRKKKKSESSTSVSRSSSEPALNQPQEAFVREAPSSAKTTSSASSGKKKKSVLKRKTRNSVLPSSSSSISLTATSVSSSSSNNVANLVREPVFHVDVRTQNTRLVTPRQRQEIYALNRVMTRLENEKFKKFCQERGYKGDLHASEDKNVVEYDIFM